MAAIYSVFKYTNVTNAALQEIIQFDLKKENKKFKAND